MARVAVAPGPWAKGFDGVRDHVREAYRVLDLVDALTATYRTDAHCVTYVIPGATRQPRVTKAGLPFFARELKVDVFFCDVDNPGHNEWTASGFGEALAQTETLGVLATAGVYHTQHGLRVVQPLATPVPVPQVEVYLRRWLLKLESAGIAVDWACRDWTRHFRLPNVRKKGQRCRCRWMDLDRMRPIELEPIAIEAQPSVSPRKPTRVPRLGWTDDLPAFWRNRVTPVAAAIREVDTEWHSLFMAVAGALLSRGVPPEHVPAICRAISIATGADTRADDRERGARSTVERWLDGLPATGYTQLALKWPGVATALDDATATGTRARVHALAAMPAPSAARSVEETTTALEDVIRNAPPGVTLISSECGLGKTAAAVKIAAERAAKTHASPDAAGHRAPLQSKTSISVDKNELAKQVVADVRAAGANVARRFGPLSLVDDEGNPVCRYAEVARALVAGGQSIQRELCDGRGVDPCPDRETCPARRGREGDDPARVTVGSHALVGALDGEAGTTGLLVIDEPPYLLDTTVIGVPDLALAIGTLDAFDGRYAEAVAPALSAVHAWTERAAEVGEALPLQDIVRSIPADPDELARAQDAAMTTGDAVECVVSAPFPHEASRAPPLRFTELFRARSSIQHAVRIGCASGVLRALYGGLTSQATVMARVEERGRKRLLFVTAASQDLVRALRREGSVVVMDASMEVQLPLYEKALGYAPPLHDFRAGDGARIARTLLWCGSASRRHWMMDGRLRAEASLVQAVRGLVAWAKEEAGAGSLGLITLLPIELALDAVLHPGDPKAAERWTDHGQSMAVLADLRRTLGPILAEWEGEILLGHFGGVRGLNHMSDADCVATLGDPWPNIGEVQNDMTYLGLDGDWESRSEALCRAELEQAHGRLRTVHRSRPGRALHIGRVLPGGSGWTQDQVDMRRMPSGRPKATPALTTGELDALISQLGGYRAAARAVGCSDTYLRRCQTGTRPISERIAASLRHAAGANQNPQERRVN